MTPPEFHDDEIERLLARALGEARPAVDFDSWRRRHIDSASLTRPADAERPARELADRSAPDRVDWLVRRKGLLAAAAAVFVLIGVFADWLIRRERGRLETPLIAQHAAPEIPPAGGAMPVVYDTRGLVLALTDVDEKQVELAAGDRVPEGREVSTCPWGASSMHYADGTSVTLDRGTTAVFSDSQHGQQVRLKNGILFVKRKPAQTPDGVVLVGVPQGDIVMQEGELAIVTHGDQTIVEVAVGTAQLRRTADAASITLSAGQHATFRRGSKLSAVDGRLQWRLEEAQSPGD